MSATEEFLNKELTEHTERINTRVPSVADLITKDLFESDVQAGGNEMLDLIQHVQMNGVALTEDQVTAGLLLHEMGLQDIANYSMAVRPFLTPMKVIFDLINKITLADRIKGTAKLNNILKAQVANPNNTVPNANELKAKPMTDKEFAGGR